MVSMKDIAQRCGVSVATVSKALNGQQDIGEDTRRTGLYRRGEDGLYDKLRRPCAEDQPHL